ncbi:hypothetical protein [Nocardioides piscis]|uniref:HPr kinase/phosphorylase C-terminal domain-containing protein n=1 Tax=Nocardioides piscis TaxID=2714938 RepID=A0A6G7YES6_9ACTN|nr:hypothetical protein [Nocardioides piscis]QIK75229.1 hypothetical protein G7071_07105 [Nocardioides piscis]
MMLHAAALADPVTGATAVLVAPSGTGKTTASTVLGRHLAYLTDETAGLTFDGAVLPYRKPLSIIESGHLKAQRSPSDLGLVTSVQNCHLVALLVIERRPAHEGEPLVLELETVDALAALAPEASSLSRLDRPLQRLVTLIRHAGGVRHVTYSEAATLAPVIQALLERSPR